MKKNIFKSILFLSAIFLLINTTAIYSEKKDKEDKEKKDKEDKEKKDKKDKKDKEDKKDKDGNIIDEDYASDIIKSDIIYSEKNNVVNSIENINKEKNKINKIISIYKILEVLLGESDDIKREIKISTPGKNAETVIQKYLNTKYNLVLVIKEGHNTLDNFNNEEKDLISQQIEVINKSNKILKKTFSTIEDDLIKESDNEEIFNKMKIIEKEMQVLYRQYRAIEWLFLEKI